MVLLELTVNEKNQEVEELKQLLETKSNELKSALKLVEVSTTTFEYLHIFIYF